MIDNVPLTEPPLRQLLIRTAALLLRLQPLLYQLDLVLA
jgi:hypothetical protein